MTNLLQDGVTWMAARLKAVAGVTATYVRGTGSVSVTATVALHEYQIMDEEGFATAFLSRDYLMESADLVIAGSAITPRAGDRITETINGVLNTFEVVPLGPSREFEPVDPDSVLIRIHTKKVAV